MPSLCTRAHILSKAIGIGQEGFFKKNFDKE